MAAGEFAGVGQYLEEALDRKSDWLGDHDLYAMLADAAAQQQDEAALERYAPLAEEAANGLSHMLYLAIAHRALGVARRLSGEYTEAEARLNRALEMFQKLETPWQSGRTLFELGELELNQVNTASARDHFYRALAAFEELKAAPDVARAHTVLESLG